MDAADSQSPSFKQNDMEKSSSFDQRFDELKAFVQKYGHSDIHRNSKLVDKTLAEWCEMTRDTYHNQDKENSPNGERRKLTSQEIEKLEGIGFKWSLSAPPDDSTNKQHQQGEEQEDIHGLTSSPDHLTLSPSTEEEYHHEGPPSNSMSSPNQGKYHGMFDEQYQQLAAFHDRYGHCDVPSQWKINPALGRWCFNLRQAYHKLQKGRRVNMKLSREEMERLERIGFKWHL
jgi:hypothetical protein